MTEQPIDAKQAIRDAAERALYKRLVISHFDLSETRNYLFKLLGEDENPDPNSIDNVIRSALQTALVVAYARPFSGNASASDVRSEIPRKFLRLLSTDERALHHEILARRNEEFAHSDPSASEVKIYVGEMSGTPFTTPVSNVTRSPISVTKLRSLDRICVALYNYIFDEMRSLEARFTPGKSF